MVTRLKRRTSKSVSFYVFFMKNVSALLCALYNKDKVHDLATKELTPGKTSLSSQRGHGMSDDTISAIWY